jgi:sigma-B regulation protein RsbU (phosphoserine phosphatase)
LLLAGAATRVLLFPFVTSSESLLGRLDAWASVAVAIGLGYLLLTSVARLRRRLLWRVRRKLIVSYVFIGFVPVLLVVAFFAVAGAMSVLSASSEIVRRELDAVVADVRVAAAAVGARLSSGMEAGAALAPLAATMGAGYPGVSALVIGEGAGRVDAAVGAWRGGPRPDRVPEWIREREFAGLVTVGSQWPLTIRAVVRVNRPAGGAVVIDVPLDASVHDRVEAATGIELEPMGGLADETLDPSRLASAEGLAWVVFLEPVDWASGAEQAGNLFIRVPAAGFMDQFFGTEVGTEELSVRYFFLVLLATLGGLFLVIELSAFVMGLALARSITGSIHALSVGTDRIRRGDFSRRISVASGDQLGDLAESFNAMTASVEGLLHQAAEKKRLENELRLARQIQMSLLPRDPTSVPGLSVSAFCRPAREIGGDYYDFIRLGERRLGLLVADVSGKGTSAALYMAELKGLMLSLGPTFESPRQLLIEVNRILAGALDSRSFITMLYAVIDLDAGTLTCARAGHTPLLYASRQNERRVVTTLAPDGLVLGLHGFERQFSELLEEHHLPVQPGDVAVLFTDGVTEAMNEEDDLFGETRLARLLEEDEAVTSETMHERIVREVDGFVGAADQHDDMTIVVLRVDEVTSGAAASGPGVVVVEPGAPS